ncbi:23S rRNA (adenine(2503)-C(2))-methyltransferase RlmN [Bifidobacterium sp.]|jgi:23S rRNA (adenine2503-C2)-methyltransferase|uniref:23S rRNA (adenine(2503)-C(2))-methyltransferase RlmN n=1 Tax=Bifidobacterium sp. TaxID=41200 RepID=UPI0025BDC11E|nr:23S rRNA (adenine(2503)-C(2))-methyltransferase RlmN [Bifidobacterium sp.]MCI1635706.1 23S rRNA (adenine(2503)-C(2))-methyltransferase RlmN [Bifidobacterium sp.]
MQITRNETEVVSEEHLPAENQQIDSGITPGGNTGAFRDVLASNHARRGKPPVHFADMTPDVRQSTALALNMPKFRVKQLANHYFEHLSTHAESFTDFPADIRATVAERFFPTLIKPLAVQEADEGTTVKTLWELFDGAEIESVLMRYPNRTTLCISSQVGCGMGCPFCATGKLGLTRNMSTGEILEQVRIAAASVRNGEIAGGPGRLSNVVFMGMGEPMGNYRAVMSAVRQISTLAPGGFGISARNITISTVGVVPGMRKLAQEGLPVRLAVSLHAPTDELRDELVPMNKRFNTTAVLDAAHDYYIASKRRVSIEYALMRGINDQEIHARQLARRLNHYGDDWVHVNPIPLNPIEGSRWTASKPEDEQRFLEILHRAGIAATLRDTRGSEIDGACGQLAAKMQTHQQS